MRKSEIEKRLKNIISNSVPDVLDNILEKCEEKKGFEGDNMKVINVEKKEKRFIRPKLVGALAMVMVFCLFGIIGFKGYDAMYKVDSSIEFDVNPSIELNINKNERVIEAIALNEDGKKILGDMDLEKVDLDVAVKAIIGEMLLNGYITEDANSVLVSVKNDNIEKGNALQERISKEIANILKANSIEGSVLTQMYDDDDDVKKLANENNLSEGKAKLIKRVLKTEMKDYKGDAYTFETLSTMSINELNLLLTSKEVKLEEVTSTGKASEKAYIGKEKAKQIAFENSKVSASNAKEIEVELDYENGKLVYEVEFKTNKNEYDYEIDAITGDIIRKNIEKNDDVYEVDNKDEKYNNKYNSNYDKYDDDKDDLDDKYDDDKYDLDDKYDDDKYDLDDKYDDDKYDLDDRYDDDDDDDFDDKYDDDDDDDDDDDFDDKYDDDDDDDDDDD